MLAKKKSKTLRTTLPLHSELNGQNQLSLIFGVQDLDGIRVES
jgi:hypothetical protein